MSATDASRIPPSPDHLALTGSGPARCCASPSRDHEPQRTQFPPCVRHSRPAHPRARRLLISSSTSDRPRCGAVPACAGHILVVAETVVGGRRYRGKFVREFTPPLGEVFPLNLTEQRVEGPDLRY